MGEFAMKAVTAVVTITEKMLQDYEAIFGKQVRIPPTFPMLFYREIEVPWHYEGAPIHRKQSSACYVELEVGERYRCVMMLDQKRQKGDYLFFIQSLIGYDMKGRECFQCVSEFVVHSRLQEK